ncbi:hypothetical protein ML462_07930 [Gramella lutea]|uniref:Uncharacterized protein n=1 Tax=Christiangramia lutea TaxID=1607951 RepID=A0A9X1V2A3_9FLAO|nr:hypothetical protein [Christiangramia lutea]MCH4823102.1 hypothetical protein [Christiangramia lutea]
METNQNSKVMSSNAIIITVSLKNSNSNPPKLKLKDSKGKNPKNENLTTDVFPGNVITWIPNDSSGVSELTDIKLKNKDGTNLLEGSISRLGNKLQGKVIGEPLTPPGKDRMVYQIGFKIYGDDNEYWSDPVLQMNY